MNKNKFFMLIAKEIMLESIPSAFVPQELKADIEMLTKEIEEETGETIEELKKVLFIWCRLCCKGDEEE
jgi:hypothetical protein